LHGELARVFGAAGGPIITVWFDIQFLLIFVGTMYAFLKYSTNVKESIIPIAGLVVMGFVGLSLVAPAITKGLPPQRWIDFGCFSFVGCIAVLFLRLWSVSKFRYALLLFLVLSPTMNLLLPSRVQPNSVLYHPEAAIPTTEVALQAPLHAQDFRLAEIVSTAVPSQKSVSTGMVGEFALMIGNHMRTVTEKPYFATDYLLLDKFFLRYGIWVGVDEAYQRVANKVDGVALEELLSQGNVIYNSDAFMLLSKY
jgi:hypothetical protein